MPRGLRSFSLKEYLVVDASISSGAAVPGAKLLSSPKVGYGFAMTRDWKPRYLAAYDAIVAQPAKGEPLPTAAGQSAYLSIFNIMLDDNR